MPPELVPVPKEPWHRPITATSLLPPKLEGVANPAFMKQRIFRGELRPVGLVR